MSVTTSEAQLSSREADAEMLQAVLAGDGTAYQGLVEKYQNRVYAMIYGMVRNAEDARDLTQEAFVKAFRNLKSFRLESSFYTWLYRIAMNLAIDHTRKQKRRETKEFDEEIGTRDGDGGISDLHRSQSPRKALERKQLMSAINDALQKLPDEQRQIVVLREVQGLSYREISEVMGIPEGTVMSRLYYARKKLQKLLERHR